MINSEAATQEDATLFANPFHIEDIAVFDNSTLKYILLDEAYGVTLTRLAYSLHGGPPALSKRIARILPGDKQRRFVHDLCKPLISTEVEQARKYVLDALFWELTYWKTPAWYEELTEGERIHDGIFQGLEPDLRGRVVLDAGAGSGRASLECLRRGASLVYAVEPSPGLRRILERKLQQQPLAGHLELRAGRFAALPLPDNSVDIALACSAFTAAAEQGGEAGLIEMRRVVRPGGKIVLIWPRIEDRSWLEQHGFHYISLPLQKEMYIYFRSLQSALHCAQRFYAHNQAVMHYLITRQRPEIPYSLLGIHPPCDYCWLQVDK
jgi:ubiquinone/menaquinone biosynthesis C-methylase UbiE